MSASIWTSLDCRERERVQFDWDFAAKQVRPSEPNVSFFVREFDWTD